MDNLLSGLIGTSIGVVLAVFFSKLATASRLNGGRKFIRAYMKNIARDLLDRYITDVYYGKLEVNGLPLDPHVRKQGYDLMPMLTSEIFKTFGSQEIARILRKQENISLVINWYYEIDYLKAHMPYNNVTRFWDNYNAHLKECSVENREAHLNCNQMKYYREVAVRQMEATAITAYECMFQLDEIVYRLNGKNWIWFIKYIFTA